MLFNSFDYALFLAFALTIYWSFGAPKKLRIGSVLVLSSVFYAAWEPRYLLLILFSTALDWLVATRIEKAHDESRPSDKKRWLTLSVVSNLGLLGFFKYASFVSSETARVAGFFGMHWSSLPQVLLPVGISFYTFESLSYCIDVYRGDVKAARSPLDLLFFITFFPKLVAGPIARPGQLLPQLEKEPVLTRMRIGQALFLIGTGLIKKVAFADVLSVNFVDRVFDTPDAYTGGEVVVALYAFTLQIYMDFSGYTDIARGSAKLFGIELPENFDRPYCATNPAEFWRRWHMSLSTWLRDYLYFPLGGSRKGNARTYFNLWLTIFLIGLWHGASWNFVLYGSIQATAVVLHRAYNRWRPLQLPERAVAPSLKPAKLDLSLPSRRSAHGAAAPLAVDSIVVRAVKIALTLQLVVFSRILFRSPDGEVALEITKRLFSGTTSLANVAPRVAFTLALGFAVHFTPTVWYTQIADRFSRAPVALQTAILMFCVYGTMLIQGSATVPYIYFQF